MDITGKISSIQSLGTVDGPGVRFVVFMQGCNLRCGCCHNPETWKTDGGKSYTARDIFEKAERCREYFGSEGGITASGGEPLLQPEFLYELFAACKNAGINTCLDTSGSILNESVKKLLTVTDRVLLDIKYSTDADYKQYVGIELSRVIDFLDYLDENGTPTTIRRVVIPTLNDGEGDALYLKNIIQKYKCIDGYELLPFKKLCTVKYESLGIDFAFKDIHEPTNEDISKIEKILK